MKDVKVIRVNLQESILFIDEPIGRVDSIIAMYSEHTNIIKVRDSFWNSNLEIETHFKKVLDIKKAPEVTSCLGFGIGAIN